MVLLFTIILSSAAEDRQGRPRAGISASVAAFELSPTYQMSVDVKQPASRARARVSPAELIDVEFRTVVSPARPVGKATPRKRWVPEAFKDKPTVLSVPSALHSVR